MPSKKMTLFFTNQTDYGWSETFYYSGDTTEPTFSNNISDLITARAGILTDTCTIVRARVASGTKRNPYIFALNGGMGTPGTEMHPTAPSEVALLCLFQAGLTGFNRAFLRGIPERVTASDSYVPDMTFTTELDAFFNVLKNGFWNCVGTLGGPPAHFTISAVIPTPPRGFSFLCTAPPGPASTPPATAIAVGDTIRVHGCRVPGYNGLKVVTMIPTATSFVVGGAAPPVPDAGSTPYLTQIGAFDTVILTCNPEKLSRRGAGRPFGVIRGRRPTLYALRQ